MPEETIAVTNAGLILVNPFLPSLFEQLDLFSTNDRGETYIANETSASRAVHLLQYLVTGQTETPEFSLTLNKLLCGLSIATPVASGIEATDQEREVCDSLLRAIIQQWSVLRGTSIEGLRKTFLQREGQLNLANDKCELEVERKTLDILIDQIPWSISIINLPWLPDPIYVEW